MTSIPRDALPDSTLALLRDPYWFIAKRCRRYETDAFQTRVLLRKTICITGEEAARIFYDTARFTREGAAPGRLQKTLFGQGGVQGLDGGAHAARKQMFLSLLAPENMARLAGAMAEQWRASLADWAAQDQVVLLEAMHEVLFRAVCRWAGVPMEEAAVKKRTRQMAAMIDGAGAAGPRYWRGRQARKSADRWAGETIARVRGGEIAAGEDQAVGIIAQHRKPDGKLLSRHAAAVELLNVLRPVTAVARFIVFAAHALHEHPQHRDKVQDDDEYREWFVQEVRRSYPFFPLLAARVRRAFEWRGYSFPEGVRVLLDLHGVNHDPRMWEEPREFRPERFRAWNESAFNFIPQGGGDYQRNHRCPGEPATIELMKTALGLLTREMIYQVPPQDLRIDHSRVPAMVKSRFVISNVAPVH